MRSKCLSRCLPWVFASGLVFPCTAQVMRDPGIMPDGHRVHFPGSLQMEPQRKDPAPSQAPAGAAQAAANSNSSAPLDASGGKAATTAPSLLDKPAHPAKITLADGKLSVDTDNSSLSQILHELASSSGMSIDGLGHDRRVFGKYGPGNPRDILSNLLDGAGYNVLMVGETSAGTPRELVLSARTNAPLSPPEPSSSPEPEVEEQAPVNNYPPAQMIRAPMAPVAPPQAPNGNGAVKSPQEILQELQRLRQQQTQQQQQAPQ